MKAPIDQTSEIHYPVVVDAKTLSALTMTGDAIIRDPRRDRIKHWARLKAIIHKQSRNLKYFPILLLALLTGCYTFQQEPIPEYGPSPKYNEYQTQ